jgi:peptide chain release factor 3
MSITGIPNFAPEILRRVRLDDPMKSKHLRKALEQLAEEGVTRIFKPLVGGDWIIGVVGSLQLDVLAARIKTEYELGVRFEPAPYETARWVDAEDPLMLKRFIEENRSVLAEDHDATPVFLARNSWELRRTMQDWPAVNFRETREQA